MSFTDTAVWPDATAASTGAHRPLLEVAELSACSEWDFGRRALMALITELSPPGSGYGSAGSPVAEWLCLGVAVSVQLVYGHPVVVFEGGGRRACVPLADAELESLRAVCRSTSSAVLSA